MLPLEFGAWGSVKINDIKRLGSAAAAYAEHLRQARMMDQLGYRYYWIIEHQASYIGAITAPTVFLTAVAAATERIHVGAMIWQLPFHNPMRLAQEVATLDHLSNGGGSSSARDWGRTSTSSSAGASTTTSATPRAKRR